MKAELADGRVLEFPDGTSPEIIQQTVKRVLAAPAAPPAFEQKFQASAPMRVVQGMRDPIDAGAQVLTHSLPNPVVDSVNRGTKYVNDLPIIGPITKALGMTPATTEQVDQGIAQNEQQYQEARKATGNEGFDWMRLGGNVISPANAGIAKIVPISPASSVPVNALKGMLAGGIGGGLQPVTDPNQSFADAKAKQVGLGAAGGAILTPILSKVGEVITRRLSRPDAEIAGARASLTTDKVISDALDEMGQKADDIPRDVMQQLRQQVQGALMKGKNLDPAAMLRQRDFNSLGVPATGGQLTRDATQFARERNLRGVAGVGEPLMTRFETQNQMLQKELGKVSGNAQEKFPAGEQLAKALTDWDETMRGKVGDAYKAARESTGKDMEVPLKGLAQDYAQTLRDFGEANIPGAVRGRLNELGLLSGKQTKMFTAQDAEELLQVIQKNYDPTRKAEASALDSVRNAVKNAILSADDQGGAFAPAREAAKMRFQLRDAVPALKAAADGTVAPDDFVKRFVINGKTNDVKMLAELLSKTDTNAFQEARNQIGVKLNNAAFGENTAGDKLFSPERYAKALREMGTDKLNAFFSPSEIERLKTAGRIGAYINSSPTASPVNYSNTAGATMSMLGKIPGVPSAISLASALKNTIGNQNVVRRAMSAEIPKASTELTPEQIRLLSKYLSAGAAGIGGASATPLR